MKSLVRQWLFIVIPFIFLSGCELFTPAPGREQTVVGGYDLLINEVFTLSPDKYYAYSWVELYNPTNERKSLFNITLPATIYVVGDGGVILRTEEDGEHWDALTGNPSSGKLNSISFAIADTGYAVGDGGLIMKIQKDSATQQFVFRDVSDPLRRQNYNAIYMVPLSFGRVGYVVGDGGSIIRTIDRGRTWRTVVSPTTKNLNGLCFVDLTRIYAVGDSSTILKVTPGGSFARQDPPPTQTGFRYHATAFVIDTGWVVGENGSIAFTSNGGGRWEAQTSRTTATLRAVFASNDEEGFRSGFAWAAGDNGTLLRTSDFGSHWESNQATQTTFNKIIFSDTMKGWAFGDGGIIVATTNGGRTWGPQSSGTSSRLLGADIPLPLNTAVINYYQLNMWVHKKHFFEDPVTHRRNFDVITKIDTGTVNFIPLDGNPLVSPPSIPPQGFLIVSSDSGKFKDHTNVGPGTVKVTNFSIAFDTVLIGRGASPDSLVLPQDFLLWNLPSAGEIRLEKIFIKTTRNFPPRYLGNSKRVVDVVRWGNFPADVNTFGSDTYPENVAAGEIPEWNSLARYGDDVGWADGDPSKPATRSTLESFYMAKTPIPGWYSQRRRH